MPPALRLFPAQVIAALTALAAAAAAMETSDLRVTITPLLGRYYRPGAWVAVRVQAEAPPAARGIFTPALEVLLPQGDTPIFSSRQPPRHFAGGEIFVGDFWLLAGEQPPRLRFALYGESGLRLASAPIADLLRPVEPGWRILLSLAAAPPAPRATHVEEILPQFLPNCSALYESVDIIVAGDLSGRPLPLPADEGAFVAIAEWIAKGGALLVFDRLWGERLEQAIAAQGWPQRPRTPFILASESGMVASPPLGLRLGNGWIVFFDLRPSPAGYGLAGQAVWEKLKRGCLRPLTADYRLSPQRQRHAPTAQPPRLSPAAVGRWLAIWLILLIGALAPFGIRPRLVLSPWPTAVASAILAILLAAVIVRREPLPAASSISVMVKTLGETGRGGPALAEEIRVLSPFGEIPRLALPFAGLPPLRPLASSQGELTAISWELFYDDSGAKGEIVIAAPQLLRRGKTIICSRTRLAAATREAPLICHAGDRMRLEATADDRRVWHDVLVRAHQQEGVRAALGPLQRGAVYPCALDVAALSPARREVMKMIAAEQAAGKYAIFLGWEEAAPAAAQAGEMQKKEEEPARAPAAENPSAEGDAARERVLELAAEGKIAAEERQMVAKAKFEAGLEFYRHQLYEEALAAFEEALAADPGHRQALAYRNKCRQLLGRPGPDKADVLIQEVAERSRAKIAAVEMQMKADIETAEKFYLAAVAPSEARKLLPVEEQIGEALSDLERALERIAALESLLGSSPISAEAEKEIRLRAKALRSQVTEAKNRLLQQRESLDREKARQAAEERKQETESLHRQRMEKLLQSAEFYFFRKEYDKARDLCEQILRLDPTNADALILRSRARAEAHKKADYDNATQLHDAEVIWQQEGSKLAIHPSEEVQYPEDWEQIKRRMVRQRQAASGSELERQIRDRLDSIRLTQEFNESPIVDVVKELSERGRVNIVLAGPEEVDPNTPVTLSVPEMTLGKILDWIMELTGFHYEIRNEAIYISRT
ncbi:MAG: hypothetical protein N3A66_00260, partial [Planctomycetota bacterium]|nr:hypothetical protein [Planctomycetota bacterium]